MDWVAEGIAVGGRREALDRQLLEWHGIEAALLIYELVVPRESIPVSGEVLQLIVRDGQPVVAETLREGVAFLVDQRAAEKRVLVACAAGISRSASFVVAYLISTGMGLEEALTELMSRRRVALPHPALLQSIAACYGLKVDAAEILQVVIRARKAARAAPDSPDPTP